MSRDPLLLRATMRLEPALELLVDHGYSGAPVIDVRGRLIGVLHALDVAMMHLPPPDGEPQEPAARRLLVGEVVREAVTIAPTATMREAADAMRVHDTDRLVVVEDADHVIGVVTGHDLLRTITRRGDLLREVIDQQIAELDLPDVQASVDSHTGVVLLVGTVDSPAERDRLVRAIGALDGVVEVDQLVTVRPRVSPVRRVFRGTGTHEGMIPR